MKSLLKSINVTVPSKKKKSPVCQPWGFDVIVFGFGGEFCTDGTFSTTLKVVGIEVDHQEFNMAIQNEYCNAWKAGNFGSLRYCFAYDKKAKRIRTHGTAS
jgi:hypothetical protein